MSTIPAADGFAHIDALLHAAALSFVITLAYLGLDKIADDHHDVLETDLAKKAEEIRQLLINDDLISPEGMLNPMEQYADRRVRSSICHLSRLAGITAESRLYGWHKDVPLRIYHCVKLFILYKAFANRWDRPFVASLMAVNGIAFYCFTFWAIKREGLDYAYAFTSFWISAFTVTAVGIFAYFIPSAVARLEACYKKHKRVVDEFLLRVKNDFSRFAIDATRAPIRSDDDSNQP